MTHQKNFKKTVRTYAMEHGLSYTGALAILAASRTDFLASLEADRASQDLVQFRVDLTAQAFLSSAGVAVHGNTGSGKTHLLLDLAHSAKKLGWDVVVFSSETHPYSEFSLRHPSDLLDFLLQEEEARTEYGAIPLLVVVDDCHEQVRTALNHVSSLAHRNAGLGIYFAWGDHGLGRIPRSLMARMYDVVCESHLSPDGRQYGHRLRHTPAPALLSLPPAGPPPAPTGSLRFPMGHNAWGEEVPMNLKIMKTLSLLGDEGTGKRVLMGHIARQFLAAGHQVWHYGAERPVSTDSLSYHPISGEKLTANLEDFLKRGEEDPTLPQLLLLENMDRSDEPVGLVKRISEELQHTESRVVASSTLRRAVWDLPKATVVRFRHEKSPFPRTRTLPDGHVLLYYIEEELLVRLYDDPTTVEE